MPTVRFIETTFFIALNKFDVLLERTIRLLKACSFEDFQHVASVLPDYFLEFFQV